MIGFITDEVAVDEVDRCLWEADERGELLVEPVGNGLQSQGALPEDDTARVHADDRVHITRYIELRQAFHARLRPVLHILLSFLEFLGQLDARMSEDDPLEVDELSLLELDVDYWPSVSNDDHLGVLVPLFNGEAGLRDLLIAGVDSLSQPNDAVLFCYLKCPLERRNGAAILVDLVYV